MCKEKILEILENAKDGNGAVPMRLVRTAFDKLPEPCEDTISRQAAIDALDCINGAEEVLRSLPPAQPEHDGFYEFLFNVINPNDMEKYIAMYHSKGVKSNE